MTQDQKDRLIEKALSEPELLTDSEADAIMADPDLRQLLSAAALLKANAQPAPVCDTEAEWQAFRQRVGAKPRPRRFTALWRVAAIIAVAVGAFAAFFTINRGKPLEEIAMFDTIFSLRDTLVLRVNAEPSPLADAPVVPVQTLRSEQPRGLLSQVEDEPDSLVIQARVDNEIALMRAECYRQIAAAKDIDLPDDYPVAVPDFPIDGIDISLLTAE